MEGKITKDENEQAKEKILQEFQNGQFHPVSPASDPGRYLTTAAGVYYRGLAGK